MARELFFAPPRQAERLPNLDPDKAAYRVLDERGFFCDDHLWPVGSLVYFEGEPNEEMEPLNDKAREAMRAYLTKLDECAAEVAKQTGKKFMSRTKTLEEAMNQLREANRRIEVVQGDGGVPIMGGRRRGRPKAVKVGAEEVAERSNEVRKKATIQAVE